ncbi:MAG: alpha-ketoacid dehydrogenase subunit beta, partial [Acidimicrobiales bacterium]|nr:alpha-ketoacid dehydrogenase subunit beta [Acidimicrobiales bacterium]
MTTVTFAQAINTALADTMRADDRVLVFGEDVGRLGGVFRVTDGLQAEFGDKRCFDTPLAEAGLVGVAIGLCLRGYRPVVEIQFDGFMYPALDQLISHVAKLRSRTRGALGLPLTIRLASFGSVGAIEHHSESPETYLTHTAGLKVVVPATPADAYSLTVESIESDDPVIVLEPKVRYWTKADLDLPVRTEPIGAAVIRRPGTDVTLVAYGPTVAVASAAAEGLVADGVEAEVIDLRSLEPLDVDTVVASVERTGRCVVIHEAPRTLGVGAEIA